MPPPKWVTQLHLATWPYAIPFLFGPRPTHSSKPKIQSGTCCAVEYKQHRYLLSAAHVVREALRQSQTDGSINVIAGPVHLTLTLEAVRDVDERDIDVATVAITAADLVAIAEAGYRIIRPESWPLPTVREGDGIVLVGYPASWRASASWYEHDFAAATQGLLVQSVHATEFIAHRDPAYLDSVKVTVDDMPPLRVGGCSGGPVFLVRPGLILVPELCGIVKQAAKPVSDADDLLFRFARLDNLLHEDGSVHRP